MEIFHYNEIGKIYGELTLGIGKFEGFHLGHQKIINTIIKSQKIPSVFVIRHFPTEFYLYSWKDRINFLEKSGIQICIWSDFEEISFWEPEKFLDFVLNFNVKEIVVGFNFFFGTHKKGNIDFLKKQAKEKNFILKIVPPVKYKKEIINTTKIKNFLKEGKIEKVNKFLGREFFLEGKVITGNSIGRTLNFPTANISLSHKINIKDGVYAVWVLFKDKFYKGALNIGTPLTFGKNERKIEVHILDFDKEIYGENLKIFFVKKIRDEKIFSSFEKLENQIKKDISKVSNALLKLPLLI